MNWISMWKNLVKDWLPRQVYKHRLLSARRNNGERLQRGYQMHLLWLTALTQPPSCSITVYYLLFNSALHFLQRSRCRDEQSVPQARTCSVRSVSIAKCWPTLFKNFEMSGTAPLWLIMRIQHSYEIYLPRPHHFGWQCQKRQRSLPSASQLMCLQFLSFYSAAWAWKSQIISVIRVAPSPSSPLSKESKCPVGE